MTDAVIPASLLLLPPQVLGALWPPELVVRGMRVCDQLRVALKQNAPKVAVKVRVGNNMNAKDFRKAFRAFLQRMEGKVQLTSNLAENLASVVDAMCGKVDELHLHPTSSSRNKGVVQTVAQCMPGLRVLSLRGEVFVDELMRQLQRRVFDAFPARCQNLQALRLVRMDFTQGEWTGVLAGVGRATTLRELHLRFCANNDEYRQQAYLVGKTVGTLSNLQSLHVQNWAHSETAPDFLDGVKATGAVSTALTALTVKGCKFDDNLDELCELLGAAPLLTQLDLSGLNRPSDDGPFIGEQVARMTGLTDLRMIDCVMSAAHAEIAEAQFAPWLTRCTELRSLAIGDISLTSTDVLALTRNLAACPRLRTLSLCQIKLSVTNDAGFGEGLAQRLSALPVLTSLNLGMISFTTNEANTIRTRLTNLRSLQM